jgi:hypothetical protein
VVVRVKLRIRALRGKAEKTVETVALVNAGFESDEPEIIVPVRLAEELELWPRLPEGTETEIYEVAGGGKVKTHRIKGTFETQVIAGEATSDPVETTVAVMEGEREVVLSDKATSAHRIVLEEVGAGIWRFRGETETRQSEEPEFW